MKPKKPAKISNTEALQRYREQQAQEKKWEEDLEEFSLRCFNLFSNETEDVIKSVVKDICSDPKSVQMLQILANRYTEIFKDA